MFEPHNKYSFYSIELGIVFLMTEGKWKPYKKEHGLTIWREYLKMPQLLNVTNLFGVFTYMTFVIYINKN